MNLTEKLRVNVTLSGTVEVSAEFNTKRMFTIQRWSCSFGVRKRKRKRNSKLQRKWMSKKSIISLTLFIKKLISFIPYFLE
jgi:hypothetical protein